VPPRANVTDDCGRTSRLPDHALLSAQSLTFYYIGK
jgi:hypothetical protein